MRSKSEVMVSASNEWYQKYEFTVKQTIESLNEQDRSSTPADTGLVLRVLEDYIESNGDNLKRDMKVLETASMIISAKHNTPDISWFDLYDALLTSCVDSYDVSGETESLDSGIEEVYKRFSGEDDESSQGKEFRKKIIRLVEAVESENAEELHNTTPYPDLETENFNDFAQSISSDVGFQYGAVEIPNNASRMSLADIVVQLSDEVSERDYSWMMTVLREWLSLYARAEATVANRNINHDELRQFMLDGQSPSEKYWS